MQKFHVLQYNKEVTVDNADLNVLIETNWISNATVVESEVEVDTRAGIVRLCHSEYAHSESTLYDLS